ncbi:hypothetical protein Tsubulata_030865 [Turnera subulata]|uniref:CBS domain-containing protein n=1 Tax=Turnera subulata TaxID=218843 RepID=A0A9Q0FQM8_9ROSI|nr:hypothetical protein Tsubulata_030865 [Turnera subulata]
MQRVLALSPMAALKLSPPFKVISFSSSFPNRRRLIKTPSHKKKLLVSSLKQLTLRVVQLTRRKQLKQIFNEIETAKRQYGKLNTIVMNAVMEACVHCGDIDSALQLFDEMSESCGVDGVTYATLLKGLGRARKIDEAFQILEAVEQGTAVGNPKLSPPLIVGLLNALIESGNLRRANGLLARYGYLFLKEGNLATLIYNLLMKGYINIGRPKDALALHAEILRAGLTPDRLTYNTLISACVKTQNFDAAIRFMEEMKDKAQTYPKQNLYPDIVTYTTLIQGFGSAGDLVSVQALVLEMKLDNLYIDRTAFTVVVDAFLNCGSTKDALSVFGEVIKLAPVNPDIRPKPCLYLSMMRAFAALGDYNMVKTLHRRMLPDSTGNIAPAVQEETDHLLMEAALNNGQVDVAMKILTNIMQKWKGISWTSRGGMNSLDSLTKTSPFQISLDEPIENIMVPLKAAQPLRGTLELKTVAMRVFRDQVVPVTDEWGCCIGLLHREDCTELNAPLTTMMRSPPPCVTTSTSTGRVIDLMLEKKYRMVVVVKHSELHGSAYISSPRPVGVFTAAQLLKLVEPTSAFPGQELTFFLQTVRQF